MNKTPDLAAAPCMPAGTRRWCCAILLYALPAGLVCFGRLGATDVVSMEGIVADGARTMIRTGDYVVPRLYGEVYTNKPPLVYWLAAASFTCWGGETEWSLRFPMAASVFLMGVVVLFLLGKMLGPRPGCLCGLAAVTSLLMIQKVRMAEFDGPLAAGTGLAMVAACMNLALARPRLGLWVIGYAALAFGFLAKGVPALAIYGTGLFVAALGTRTLRRLFTPAHLLGVAVFAVPVCVWCLIAYQRAGMEVFQQHFDEIRSRSAAWTLRSFGITLLKPLIVAVLFLPWSPIALPTLSRDWRLGRSEVVRRLISAAWCFVACGIGVFMLSAAQGSRYYLPLCAPIGILAGLAADSSLDGLAALPRRRRWAIFGGAVILLAIPATWAVDTFAVQPYRTRSRSFRAVAASFSPNLPDDAVVWTESNDSYSSLFFYLRHPVRSFSLESGRPPLGAYVVLPSKRFAVFRGNGNCVSTELGRATHRRHEFTLARIGPP